MEAISIFIPSHSLSPSHVYIFLSLSSLITFLCWLSILFVKRWMTEWSCICNYHLIPQYNVTKTWSLHPCVCEYCFGEWTMMESHGSSWTTDVMTMSLVNSGWWFTWLMVLCHTTFSCWACRELLVNICINDFIYDFSNLSLVVQGTSKFTSHWLWILKCHSLASISNVLHSRLYPALSDLLRESSSFSIKWLMTYISNLPLPSI